MDEEDTVNGQGCAEEWSASARVRPKKFVMTGDDKVKEGKVVQVKKKSLFEKKHYMVKMT